MPAPTLARNALPPTDSPMFVSALFVCTLLQSTVQALRIEPPTALASCYEGQRIVLRAAFELPGELLRDERLLQLYQQPLDVPLALRVPWWNGVDGLEAREELPFASAHGARLVFNDAVRELARAQRVDPFGGELVVLALERVFVARRAGELTLPGATLSGALAARADTGLLGPIVVDHESFALAETARALLVLPLPEQGRPAGFRGAIGELRVHVELSAAQVEAGRELALRVVVEGDGNHGDFELADPRLPAGAQVRARSASHDAERSRFEFALVAERAGELELAPLEFPYFDPRVGEYRVARASALRARVVRAGASATPASSAPRPTPGAGFSAKGTLLRLCAIGGAVLATLAAIWVLALRRRAA